MKKSLLLFCAFTAVALGAGIASASTITLTGTVRDFLASGTPAGIYNGYAGVGHVDFQSWCCGNDYGIVTSPLGADGKPVYSVNTSSSTHGAEAFNQWFNDTPGVNVSTSYDIILDDTGHAGIYTYADPTFFPIDGQLFADSACCGHNYSFTYELHTTFGYTPGQTFSFTGDDDVFVYINDIKRLDLGGVHSAASSSINLDNLGLTVGENYDLDIFFAERLTTASSFRIDTSIASLQTPPGQPVPEPSTLFMLAAGAPVLFAIARIRNRKCSGK